MAPESFPIDLEALESLWLSPRATPLTEEQKSILKHNIQPCRDAIVFFTARAGAKGLSGRTGGAFDTVLQVSGYQGLDSAGVEKAVRALL
jgi:hypothetical protein